MPRITTEQQQIINKWSALGFTHESISNFQDRDLAQPLIEGSIFKEIKSIVEKTFNVCSICSASDGRAGVLRGNPLACMNCHETRKTGSLMIFPTLQRNDFEIMKTMELVNKDMKRKIIKLSIFDFDGTLVNTELPETGKPKWKDKKGEDWKHEGWWGRADSLDLDVFENQVIEHVVEDYKREKNDESNLVVMLTGRRAMLSKEVELILDKHGLVFDRRYYNTGGETITCKLRKLDELVREFPDVELVEIWEDREPHTHKFKEWGEKYSHFDVKVNLVVQEDIEPRHKN